MFQKKMLSGKDKQYPLDWEPTFGKDQQEEEDKFVRTNIFKNIVFQIIIKVRNDKKKPRLSDILKKVGDSKTQE
jgi:hypothetical protein